MAQEIRTIVVLSVTQLDCLDLLVWLRLGSAVRERVGLTESTISRGLRRVSDNFGVSVVKEALVNEGLTRPQRRNLMADEF